jgi:hypothetical protein
VHHDRGAGVLEQAPCVVQQRVAHVERADLDVDLEDLGACLEPALDVRRRARLRVERGAAQAPRGVVGEVGRPGVEELRHVRLVRVGQRREPVYAEAAERGHQLFVGCAVLQRPRPADQRSGGVELVAHLGHHPGRQEVRVDVEQPRHPEILDEPLRGLDRLDRRAHQSW